MYHLRFSLHLPCFWSMLLRVQTSPDCRLPVFWGPFQTCKRVLCNGHKFIRIGAHFKRKIYQSANINGSFAMNLQGWDFWHKLFSVPEAMSHETLAYRGHRSTLKVQLFKHFDCCRVDLLEVPHWQLAGPMKALRRRTTVSLQLTAPSFPIK